MIRGPGRPGGGRHGTAGSRASHKGTASTTGHWPGGRAGHATQARPEPPPLRIVRYKPVAGLGAPRRRDCPAVQQVAVPMGTVTVAAPAAAEETSKVTQPGPVTRTPPVTPV